VSAEDVSTLFDKLFLAYIQCRHVFHCCGAQASRTQWVLTCRFPVRSAETLMFGDELIQDFQAQRAFEPSRCPVCHANADNDRLHAALLQAPDVLIVVANRF